MAAYEKTLAGDSGTVAVESAPAPQASHQREIFISYAWGGESEVMADRIEQALVAREIPLIRDKRNLGFKGRIRDFMREIGRGKAVIVIISDKYLKSENCMFELIEIAKNGDFYDRIFPIVLEDAQIYKPVARLNYIKYWEHEITALDEAMKDVNAANLQGIRESMDLYTEIRATMSRLVDILADMNALTPETHTESGFAELIAAIEAKINE
ncbi:MAG: toll/interleukin-1 receptor domain-containing protein [Gemmatimonadetes bacterium]|nr:MAG: toll/interleukin-1 receptor domain-containing protein [Gemmatimonadota bacterium]